MLTAGVVCAGVTVVGDDGYPSCYDPTAHLVMCASNVDVCTLMTVGVVELSQGTGADAPSLAVSNPNFPLLVS